MKRPIGILLTFFLVLSFVVLALGIGYSETGNVRETVLSDGFGRKSGQKCRLLPGETLEAGEIRITMEKSEKLKNSILHARGGKMIIRAYFNILNSSGEDKSMTAGDFSCYADGLVCRRLPLGGELLLCTTVSDGKAVKGYIYYEVPESARNIVIEYKISRRPLIRAAFKVII